MPPKMNPEKPNRYDVVVPTTSARIKRNSFEERQHHPIYKPREPEPYFGMIGRGALKVAALAIALTQKVLKNE